MKIIRRAAAAAATAVVATAVAMGGTASAVPMSARQTTAPAAPAHAVRSAVQTAASGWGKAHPCRAWQASMRGTAPG